MSILKRKKHKHKFTRRRALECTFIEKSKNNPGYLKYEVTIGEKDGTINKQPVYGKDMQDALSRLINKELTVKVEKKLETNVGVIFLLWIATIGWPVFVFGSGNPVHLVFGFGSVAIAFAAAAWWYNYVNRGQ